MRAAFVCIVLIPLLLGSSGCQCFKASNLYYNLIDDISDTQIYADRLYRPTWDLTRIGKPDWCSSRINRWWCKCCNDCQPHYVSSESYTEYSDNQYDNSETHGELMPLPDSSTYVPPDAPPNDIQTKPAPEAGPDLGPLNNEPSS